MQTRKEAACSRANAKPWTFNGPDEPTAALSHQVKRELNPETSFAQAGVPSAKNLAADACSAQSAAIEPTSSRTTGLVGKSRMSERKPAVGLKGGYADTITDSCRPGADVLSLAPERRSRIQFRTFACPVAECLRHHGTTWKSAAKLRAEPSDACRVCRIFSTVRTYSQSLRLKAARRFPRSRQNCISSSGQLIRHL